MTRRLPTLEDEAAAWVSRMDTGNWSVEDEADLQRWLQGDPARPGALLQAEAAWISVDRTHVVIDHAGDNHPTFGARLHRRRLLVATGAALAASVIAGVAITSRDQTYQTTTGEILRMPLADGSIASINTNSSLVVSLGQHRRDIGLARGEAWFQVAKDRTRPFVVRAGNGTFVALGTAFSVRRRAEGVDVIVTEGLVRASSSTGGTLFLSEGQRATLRHAVLERVPVTGGGVDQALAWRDGKIDLSGERLGDAIDEFNRYNRRQIVLVDERLSGEQLDGIFHTDDVEGFARAVHDALGVPVSQGGDGEIRIGGPEVA